MKFRMIGTLGGAGLALLASGLAGCTAILPQAGWGPPPPGAPPLVQNCALLQMASPPRWACDGKVYTAFDLERMRLAWETAQNTEAHPGNTQVH
jgi:hypothetical protein